jgi:hypothetical protein
MDTNTTIPNRFETLLQESNLNLKALIFPVEEDLRAFTYLSDRASVQSSGIMSFVLGKTGIGKTTSVYSASVHLPDLYERVFPIPEPRKLKLREVLTWLGRELPTPTAKTLPVLFDGREVTDDNVGLNQFISGLNQLLRYRKDILFFWPTNNADWHKQIRDLAEELGGANLAPKDSDISIVGPSKDNWFGILERLLDQRDLNYNDLAIERSTLSEIIDSKPTVGEFLGEVSGIIARRITETRKIKRIPQVLFVVTSTGNEVVGEANRIRRATTQRLKGEELVAYSKRSEAGKYWVAHQKNPEHHLSYIITLFDARLATLTHSAVVYACLHYGSATLQQVVRQAGITPHTTNAAATFKVTDFYRFLAGEEMTELTSTRKGSPSNASLEAYSAIQKLSSKKHKEINIAICNALANYLQNVNKSRIQYEVDAGDQNLYTDAILPIDNQEFYLEFHHLSQKRCLASAMSAYIMKKLRGYAYHYNLIPR